MQQTQRRLRVSPSLVISILALVVATSSGAYAAVTIAEKNSVVSKSIKNKNVKSADIKPGAVKVKQLGSNSVDGTKIADGTVGTADIGDGQVGLNDLAAATKTDLNDATTLGGLTVAQIVAASGGEYYEGKQATASINIPATEDIAAGVATLQLPHAGKYLVTARIPVVCSFDNSAADPDAAAPSALDNPYVPVLGTLSVGGTQVESQQESCAVEQGIGFFTKVWSGTTTIEFTRQVVVAGPTAVSMAVSGDSSTLCIFGCFEISNNNKATATASESIVQAITVQ